MESFSRSALGSLSRLSWRETEAFGSLSSCSCFRIWEARALRLWGIVSISRVKVFLIDRMLALKRIGE